MEERLISLHRLPTEVLDLVIEFVTGKGEVNEYAAVFQNVSKGFTALFLPRLRLPTDLPRRVSVKTFFNSVSRLQWAMSMGGKVYRRTYVPIAKGGHLDVLKWLRTELRHPECVWDASVYAAAAEGGHIDVLEWLREEFGLPGGRYYEWDQVCAGAAKGGQYKVFSWLMAFPDRPIKSKWPCSAAARAGDLAMLQWLRSADAESPWPWTAETCAAAAEGGHLEVLQWLRGQGCPWDATACRGAAAGGHLEVLKWLREDNDPPCEWNESSMLEASEEIYLWALENDCPPRWAFSDF